MDDEEGVYIPLTAGSINHYSNFPEAIMPSFQYSNWGEAPKFGLAKKNPAEAGLILYDVNR